MLVYMLLNTVTEKAYVGLTTTRMRERLTRHKKKARGSLKAAFEEYPYECWECVALEQFDDVDALLQGERRWIQACGVMDPAVGYNDRMPDEAYAMEFKRNNPGPYEAHVELGWWHMDGHIDALQEEHASWAGRKGRAKSEAAGRSKRKADMTPEEIEFFREAGRRATSARSADFYRECGKRGAARKITS